MWKYLAIFVVILALAAYVSIQDEHTAENGTQKTTHRDNSLPATADKEHPQEHVENTEWHSPGWYSFFRWPVGTTTWAIILTLCAIAEQTGQTKKAAKASETAAEAANRNAEIAINAQRSLIMTEVNWQGLNRIYNQTEKGIEISRLYIVLRGKNDGRTPA